MSVKVAIAPLENRNLVYSHISNRATQLYLLPIAVIAALATVSSSTATRSDRTGERRQPALLEQRSSLLYKGVENRWGRSVSEVI